MNLKKRYRAEERGAGFENETVIRGLQEKIAKEVSKREMCEAVLNRVLDNVVTRRREVALEDRYTKTN